MPQVRVSVGEREADFGLAYIHIRGLKGLLLHQLRFLRLV